MKRDPLLPQTSESSEFSFLGILIDEHLTFEDCAKVLSDSAGRALGDLLINSKVSEMLVLLHLKVCMMRAL